MDILETLFDYQRFAQNARLQARLDDVYARYLTGGEELSDDALELAAAGEPQPPWDGPDPIGAARKGDG